MAEIAMFILAWCVIMLVVLGLCWSAKTGDRDRDE